MRVFYKRYECPKCGWKYGQTEKDEQLIKEICKTCKWGHKY